MIEELLHLPFTLSLMTLIPLSLGLYLVYLLTAYVSDPLRDIPGPFIARFTKLWYLLEIYKGDFEHTNIALHKKYGPIVRFAPGQYSIDDPEAAKIIYGTSTGAGTFVKASWYKPFIPPALAKVGLFASTEPHVHASQRRKFASAFSMTSLVSYEPYVDACSSLFTSQLHSLATSHKKINLGKWLHFYAFDVIGEITFGNRFGFIEAGEDKDGVFEGIEQRTAYSTYVGVFPSLHRWIFPLLSKKGGHAYVGNYTRQQMAARELKSKDPRTAATSSLEKEDSTDAAPPSKQDFMTKFLAVHKANPDKFSTTDLFAVCLSNIGAGSDSTATTLSAIFYYLLKNPSSYAKLREEIDVAAREGRISNPVTFKQSQDELPYLQAVIKEALRLCPATSLPLVRIVPSSGATLAGRFFPPGTTVGINPWVAHRNPSVFGADAETWRPERWLESSKQNEAAFEKYFMAFGMGSRTCIGKNISLLEMSKMVPQVVRGFELRFAGRLGGEVGKGDRKEREWKTCSRWFVKAVDLEVVVEERKVRE